LPIGSTHNQFSKSKIYSSVWGNAITGIVRSVLAITAKENKAYMVVTDSLVCDHNTLLKQPSSKITTPYTKLNFFLHSFEWGCDFSNVHFAIFKERDYFSFKVINDNEEKNVFKKLETSTGDEATFNNMLILKAAKRGLKVII
jgi:hypothetical protein